MTSDDFKISKADAIIQQLNVQTAKKCAFLLGFCFIVFHTFLHLKFGNDSCKWLLQDLGRFKGDREWQVRTWETTGGTFYQNFTCCVTGCHVRLSALLNFVLLSNASPLDA